MGDKNNSKDELIKKLKQKIFNDCMSNPNKQCDSKNCPLHDVFDTCYNQKRRGEF